MLPAVASYFAEPTPSGAWAVKTCPQRLHRSFWSCYTLASTGAWPVIRTSTPGRAVS